MMKKFTKCLGKIMLVSSETCGATEKCLRAAGFCVVKMWDGVFALACAKRKLFDLAVLVSMGKSMDLAERFFALREIDPSMQIIIIAGPQDEKNSQLANRIGARELANAHVLTIAELQNQLLLPQSPSGSEN